MELRIVIIDSHSHMTNEKFFDEMSRVGGDWGGHHVERLRAIQVRKPHFAQVGPRLDQLERASIDMQVVTSHAAVDCNLVPGDLAEQLAFARVLNDAMGHLADESQGKLLGAAAVPMASIEQGGLQEVERAIDGLGLKGLAIPTNVLARPIDAPEFESFWALAEERELPVFVHPVHPATTDGRPYEGEFDLRHNFGWPFETTLMLARLVFSGVMERHPRLKVVSHHMGGGLIPFFMGRTTETYQNPGEPTPSLPKPLFEYFQRFYYDTAVGGSGPAIRCGVDVFGAEQVVFATDAPWGPGSGEFRLLEYPQVIRSLGLGADAEDRIFFQNAKSLLGLS